MNYLKLKNFSKGTIKYWTNTAKQCYLLGANCEKCTILPEDIKKDVK